MEIGQVKISVDGNTFTASFSLPFIPPSKLEEKDKFEPYNGSISVEPFRLFEMYRILNNTIKGKMLDTIFFLHEKTDDSHYVFLTPYGQTSEKHKKKGAILGLGFMKKTQKKVLSGRVLLNLPQVVSLRNEIRSNGKLQLPFCEVDDEGKPHAVILQRNKGKIGAVFPLELEFSENKKNKLEVSVEMLREGQENIPTTVIGNKLVFRKANNGKFVIHTPHHSVDLSDKDIEDLYMLVN